MSSLRKLFGEFPRILKSISNSKLRRRSSVRKGKTDLPTTPTTDVVLPENLADEQQVDSTISNDKIEGQGASGHNILPTATADSYNNSDVNQPFIPDRIEKLTGVNSNDESPLPLSVQTPPAATASTIADDDLPCTQLVDNRVLKNVLAYVEVRSTNDNRSEAIRKELEQLGAAVTKKFTDDVTHVVFKEGSKRTKNKAVKNKVHLVSVLWVDSCKQYQEHVSERLYPAVLPTTDKGTPLFLAKLKKAKSMQPSNFDDEVANSAERCNKRKKHLAERLQSSDSTPQNSPNLGRILVQETQPRTPIDMNTPIRLLIPDTPPSMREKLKQLKSKDSENTPARENEDEEPLQRRLFTGIPNASFDSNDTDHLIDGLKDEINNCIESMPESPLPRGLKSSNVSSPSTSKDKTTTSQQSPKSATVIKPCRKSPKSTKRRKSIAAVKFVDEAVKVKRTSNRRKSVAVCTPSKIQEETENDELSSSNKNTVTLNNSVSAACPELSDAISENSNNNNVNVLLEMQNKKAAKERRKSSITKRRSSKQSIGDSPDDHHTTVDNPYLLDKSDNDNKILECQTGATSTNSDTTSNISKQNGSKRVNSKKKLLPLSDMDPVMPLLSKTPDNQTPLTAGRKRNTQSLSDNKSNISAFFPEQSSIHKRPRVGSHIETRDKYRETATSSTSTDITMTDDLTLQETTINSSTATQGENSMSAVFGESVITGRIAPRPSIDEFNLRKGIKQIRRQKSVSTSSQRKSDSDSSDGCKKTYRRSPPSRPSIVMTSLHAEEQDVVISVVKKLGHFTISDNVTDNTTHLICGGPRRTLNVLYGIMRGIWIVHKQWVLSSLESMTWLPEEGFEVTDYFPVVKVTREGKYFHKENYQSLSLSGVGSIYIAQKTSPPRHHLLNLLRLCGAKVTSSINKADIYMGHEFVPGKTSVNPVWVLDCITQQQQLDIDRYLLGRPKRESSPEF